MEIAERSGEIHPETKKLITELRIIDCLATVDFSNVRAETRCSRFSFCVHSRWAGRQRLFCRRVPGLLGALCDSPLFVPSFRR
jgi:hypothetical protein